MDLWIAVAAAGASYIAKHWRNRSRDMESLSESPSGDSKFVKPESPLSIGQYCDKSCPLKWFAQRKRPGEDVLTEREQAVKSDSSPEVASTSGFDGEKLVNSDNYEDCNVLSLSSLSPVHLQDEDLQLVEDGLKVNGNMGENFSNSFFELSMIEMSTSYGFTKNRSSLRSKQSNRQFIKPLTSLESCLMAQLCTEQARMEEYLLSYVTLPSSPTVKPFFGTNGRRIISSGESGSFNLQIETRKNKLQIFGVPPLPYVGSLEFPRMKDKSGKGLCEKLSNSSKMVNGKHCHSLAGSSHGTLLFGLGLSLGLIYSFLANKRELNKLNDLLKQTENLVQDLQDELDMKDSLTVKELAIEDDESQDTCYPKMAPDPFYSEQNLDSSTKYDGKELPNGPNLKAEKDSESMSKIEAELEAELERLELNMNSSSLERRLSDVVELDPDFIPGITQGELRPEMFGRRADSQPFADRDGSGTSTPHSSNYAVSPRELSLRLHEVIQSRLEERVKDLETALESSQRKVQFMESEHKLSWRDYSDSELRSSSYQGSPIVIEERNAIDQPVVINLTGEPSDAYNEACEEIMKMNESEEADLTSVGKKKHQTSLPLFDQHVYQGQNDQVNHYQPNYTIANGEAMPVIIPHEVRTLDDDHVSLGHVGFGGDESDSSHDEMEKLLIKQIVEKTKKGSSVLLNVRKGLFSADEYEH